MPTIAIETTEPTTAPLNGERLLSFSAISRKGILPRPPITTLRYVTRGVKVSGRIVKLEAVRIGRQWFTSAESCARFIAECNEPGGPAAAVAARPGRHRARPEAAEAARELDRLGVR